jgi:DNA-binding MarR family transcriptional regulator
MTRAPEQTTPQPTPTEDSVAAWRALLLAQSTALRAIDADLQRDGHIPLHWYDVLLELNAAPGRKLRIQQLASRVVLTRTRVSRLVDRLADNGLVSRQPDPEDGRACFAVITPAGRRALRDAGPVYLAGIQRHFARHLTGDQTQTIAEGLEQVVAAHRVLPDPVPHPARERR